MKLYHSARSSAAYRVRIALAYKGLAWESRMLNMQTLQHAGPAYRSVNPAALVPSLDIDGQVLTQSLAIIEYLEETHPQPPLLPEDPFERVYVRAVSQLVACEIHPLNNVRALDFVRKSYGQGEDGIRAWYWHWIADGFSKLESLLQREKRHGRYCLGDRISMADCCLVPQLANARRYACDLAPYPTLVRIDEACREHPAFIEASPEQQKGEFWKADEN
ncbi:MAG: maleylacetoacetate isomerase [Betaproteobacteria bacterium RIFCSPLOWO2_02_FULL_62_17]|nr:MAG: maleylacetoacetate isomerase [Betaproteobacteria bacterium RIFCSPLOWO2_02_FULL_62_17]